MHIADRIWQYLWDQHGLERRSTQLDLAMELRAALSHGQPSIGLFEAPTGAGKSLPMLVEGLAVARHRHQPVWIATHRRDLQTQLIRDLELLTTACTALAIPLPTVYKLQGLEHTLCHLLASHQEPPLKATIEAWLHNHPDGNLDLLPETIPRLAVSMPAAGCQGESCQYYATCLSQQPRQHINEYDLVITNHALLASTIRRPFLPAPKVVLIDEAHLLESTIRQTLTFSTSLNEITRHAGAFLRHLPSRPSQRIIHAREALTALLHITQLVQCNLTDHVPRKANSLLPLFGPQIHKHTIAQKAVNNAQQVLDALRTVLKTFTRLQKDHHVPVDKLDIATLELTHAEQNLAAFCSGDFDQYFLNRTESGSLGFLRIPNSIYRYARKRLWEPLDHAILLSGTLATSNTDPFAAIRGVLGIPGALPTTRDVFAPDRRLFERVFLPSWTPDLRLNLVPPDFPSVFIPIDPTAPTDELHFDDEDILLNPDWVSQSADLILQQDQTQPQGIVVLSTSYDMQDAIVQALERRLTRPTIVQPKQHLATAIHRYTTGDPRAILFTVAGWAGMDLPNAYIQDLFILKLPLQARAQIAVPTLLGHGLCLPNQHRPKHHLNSRQYYAQIQRPAIIMMRQAIGRPIRRPTDRSSIWILDRRLAEPGTQSLFFGGVSRRYLYPSTRITQLPSQHTTEVA